MNKPSRVRTPKSVAPSADSLVSAAETLFGTVDKPLVLRGGRQVLVQQGKTRHVGILLRFFNALIDKLDRTQIVTLVTMIQEAGSGGSAEAKDVESLVTKAFDKSALVLTLLHAVNDVLPEVITAMSNLSKEDFLDLDLDEGGLVAYTVFALNYDFFSRNLPAVLRVSLAQAARSVAGK